MCRQDKNIGKSAIVQHVTCLTDKKVQIHLFDFSTTECTPRYLLEDMRLKLYFSLFH